MEDIAQAAATGLSEGALSTPLGRQADTPEAAPPGPDWGRPCTVRRAERPLAFRGGTASRSATAPMVVGLFSPNDPCGVGTATAVAPPCCR